jgi:hypothetical protein
MTDTHCFQFGAPATFIGATVTAIVYSAITTTGDIAASATGSGIELTGNVLGYGTELVAGSMAGNTIRTIAKTYSAAAKPAILTTSRFSALGLSLLAGTGAAITTNALEKVGSCLYSYYKDYKQHVTNNLQKPIEANNLILIDEEEKGENIVLIENELTHSPLDL